MLLLGYRAQTRRRRRPLPHFVPCRISESERARVEGNPSHASQWPRVRRLELSCGVRMAVGLAAGVLSACAAVRTNDSPSADAIAASDAALKPYAGLPPCPGRTQIILALSGGG